MKQRWVLWIAVLLVAVMLLGGCSKEMATVEEITALRNDYYAQFGALEEVKSILDDKGYAGDTAHEASYSGAVKTLQGYYSKLPMFMDEVTKEELGAHYTQLDEIVALIEDMKEKARAVPPADPS